MLICAGDAPSVEVEEALAPLTADGSLNVSVREVPEEPEHGAVGSTYVLTVHGGDRAGIVSTLVGEVARVGGNITDLTTRLSGDLYVLVAEVDLPAGCDLEALQADLHRAGEVLGVDIGLRRVESDEL
jgi:glycine cleavage system transcriptional repressor